MSEKVELPHLAAGKISEATQQLMDQAKARFGVTNGALVRMALDDFMPRYLNAGQAEEFATKVADTIQGDAAARAEVERVLRKIERRRREASSKAEAAA